MSIIIAGYGFVGKAHETFFKNHYNLEVVDPKYKHVGLQHLDPEAVIICVNTPELENGECDISNVLDVLSKTKPTTPVLIKSTISLEGWDIIKKDYPKHTIAFSPEFLRANSAVEDICYAEDVLLGGDALGFWMKFYKDAYRKDRMPSGDINVLTMPVKDLILIKYFRNAFLATKVSYFNQIFDLCEATGVDYKNVQRGVAMDERIGKSHTEVNTSRGYGGHCFPKDVKAILATAKANDVNLSLIEQSQQYNNKVRKEI